MLNVQIGNNTPTKVTKSEHGTVDVSYDVSEPTYVYLYASTSGGNAARLNRAGTAGANSVLLYGYKVTIGGTGINAIRMEAENGKVFELNGRQVKTPGKGVYIINGRKVVVKLSDYTVLFVRSTAKLKNRYHSLVAILYSL